MASGLVKNTNPDTQLTTYKANSELTRMLFGIVTHSVFSLAYLTATCTLPASQLIFTLVKMLSIPAGTTDWCSHLVMASQTIQFCTMFAAKMIQLLNATKKKKLYQ